MLERARLVRYELGKLHSYLSAYITPGAFWGLVVCQAALLFLTFAAINQSRETHKLQMSNTHLIISNHKLAVQGAQAHRGVCAFRKNLERQAQDSAHQIHQTKVFLRHHPNGIAGIPASVLRQALKDRGDTLDRQRAALESLGNIGCNTEKKRRQ